jgi:hypothetical protein
MVCSAGGFEEVPDSDEASQVESPRVCRCENQLAHWDWAGRLHSDLPEWCRPAVGNGPRALTPLEMDYHTVDDGKGKLSVQLLICN